MFTAGAMPSTRRHSLTAVNTTKKKLYIQDTLSYPPCTPDLVNFFMLNGLYTSVKIKWFKDGTYCVCAHNKCMFFSFLHDRRKHINFQNFTHGYFPVTFPQFNAKVEQNNTVKFLSIHAEFLNSDNI